MSDYCPIPLEISEIGGEPKYEFYMDGYTLKCKRYGEEWRDFCGDSAVSALFIFANELIERCAEIGIERDVALGELELAESEQRRRDDKDELNPNA